ncbi:MAG: bifunctional (p)ppGpp synthetase/guanosine-3',5'-bis(diphosphate) 3'-pyrophosphohydrolase [Deltaproteobacteria bacterium]|nr:bifunctional (p)ppGpp synthetase/guanosine-3',5'-bis(diphosphate) 3'-pyrophosphohydrolase [Deltaproteobacteria bacterium]
MSAQPIKLDDILSALLSYHPTADVDLVKKSYVYAASHHQGQVRDSGEEFIVHPLQVARVVCDLRLDEVSIAAALLHDTVEDTEASITEVKELFGPQVADIVEGVTNLSRMSFSSREERQAENFRKMLLAMSKDIRVILVKLADRLHNMRTLVHTGEERAVRKAQETMDVYAPLANRLGLYAVKSELEDISFHFLNPEAWDDLDERLRADAKKRRKFLDRIRQTLEDAARDAHLSGHVFAREKLKYSIHRKMLKQGIPFEEVYDIIGFRVILSTVEECWQMLGIAHQLWRPVPGRFKDYISLPKPNGYRSLHTAVIGPDGQRMEVQIRTREMHEVAERGIAAHWKYKEGRVVSPADEARIRYLKQLIEELMELNETVQDPVELYTAIKEGLSFEQIFVFTPKGDVKDLPRGATPVDFAFAVHSEVGMRCAGARVNGVMVQINHQLKNGDVVEIITNPNQRPSQDWLRFLRSTRARAKVRRLLRSEARDRYVQIGRVLLEKELRKYDLTLNKLSKSGQLGQVATDLSLMGGEEGLYFHIGSGKLEAEAVAEKLVGPERLKASGAPAPSRPLAGLFQMLRVSGRGKVLVGGQDDVMVKYGKCCNPIPGERIVGFVTRGRGITVHSAECPYVQVMDQDRFVEVDWDRGTGSQRQVTVKVTSLDSPGLLSRLSLVFSGMGLNIIQAIVRTADEKAENIFKVEIKNLSQLKTILRGLQRVQGVLKVERIQG